MRSMSFSYATKRSRPLDETSTLSITATVSTICSGSPPSIDTIQGDCRPVREDRNTMLLSSDVTTWTTASCSTSRVSLLAEPLLFQRPAPRINTIVSPFDVAAIAKASGTSCSSAPPLDNTDVIERCPLSSLSNNRRSPTHCTRGMP